VTLSDKEEHAREVRARFGLAVYHAQVLEHAIANALFLLDLIHNRSNFTKSHEEWGEEVDAFMGRNFEATMGRLVKKLRRLTDVPLALERLLASSLEHRNWLAHHIFRERSNGLLSIVGRDQMIREVEECRACFIAADDGLERTLGHLRIAAGITDAMIEREYQRVLAGIQWAENVTSGEPQEGLG